MRAGWHRRYVSRGLDAYIRSVLGACDVGFVLSFREAASYAACEAMAMGLPVLVCNAGGLPEIIRAGVDGWIVPVGDVDAVERAPRDILADPKKRIQMGASARTQVTAMLGYEQFIRDTKAVYQLAFTLARADTTL